MNYTIYFNYRIGNGFEVEPEEISSQIHEFLEGFFESYGQIPSIDQGHDETLWTIPVNMSDDSLVQAFGPAVRAFMQQLIIPFENYKWVAGNYQENANNDFIYLLYDINHNDKVCLTFVPMILADQIEDENLPSGPCQ